MWRFIKKDVKSYSPFFAAGPTLFGKPALIAELLGHPCPKWWHVGN
jgi:hypothetical protein